jgi:hypothetical protein
MKNNYILYLIIVLFLISACSKIGVDKPEGFAEIKTTSSYYAVSPEGVLYRVRYVKNYPEKELAFWQEAVKTHLEKEGYELMAVEEFDTGGKKKGIFFEWGAPYGHENYIYMTAISVYRKRIAIAEAAGEYGLYHQYREALLSSMTSMMLK